MRSLFLILLFAVVVFAFIKPIPVDSVGAVRNMSQFFISTPRISIMSEPVMFLLHRICNRNFGCDPPSNNYCDISYEIKWKIASVANFSGVNHLNTGAIFSDLIICCSAAVTSVNIPLT